MKDMYFGLESHMLYWLIEEKKWDLYEIHRIVLKNKKQYEQNVHELWQEQDTSILEKYDIEEDVFVLYYETWIQKLEYLKSCQRLAYESFRLSIHSLLPSKFVWLLERFGTSEDVLTCVRFYIYKNIFRLNESNEIQLNITEFLKNGLKEILLDMNPDRNQVSEAFQVTMTLLVIHFNASFKAFLQDELRVICQPFIDYAFI